MQIVESKIAAAQHLYRPPSPGQYESTLYQDLIPEVPLTFCRNLKVKVNMFLRRFPFVSLDLSYVCCLVRGNAIKARSRSSGLGVKKKKKKKI